jgi:hypothetical protein
MSTKVLGYTLTLKWNGKFITGLETTGLKIKPNFDEILLKADAGVPVKELIDYDTNMSFAGKTFNNTGDEDFETLREAAAAGTPVAFIYGDQAGYTVSGNGIIEDFSEDANSKDIGTFSGSIRAVKGTVDIDEPGS